MQMKAVAAEVDLRWSTECFQLSLLAPGRQIYVLRVTLTPG